MAAPASLPSEAIAYARQFFDAARAGSISTFLTPLAAGLPANLRNDKGDTLIMLASYHGHAELVKLLIEYGADPNIVNDRGQSCLAGAVFKKEDEVINALLEGGGDPDWGAPSATDSIKIFKQEDKWGKVFEEAKGKGKGGEAFVPPPKKTVDRSTLLSSA